MATNYSNGFEGIIKAGLLLILASIPLFVSLGISSSRETKERREMEEKIEECYMNNPLRLITDDPKEKNRIYQAERNFWERQYNFDR